MAFAKASSGAPPIAPPQKRVAGSLLQKNLPLSEDIEEARGAIWDHTCAHQPLRPWSGHLCPLHLHLAFFWLSSLSLKHILLLNKHTRNYCALLPRRRTNLDLTWQFSTLQLTQTGGGSHTCRGSSDHLGIPAQKGDVEALHWPSSVSPLRRVRDSGRRALGTRIRSKCGRR